MSSVNLRLQESRFNLAVLLAAIAAFCLTAALQRPEASWDLRNYHLYNPFALLNKPFGYDLVPAQLQTFLNPALDVPFYFARTYLNNWPRLLNALQALPQGLAAFLVYLIALEIIPPNARGRRLLGLIAAVFGSTGAASLPTLGTSQSEMLPACFLLSGLLLVLRNVSDVRLAQMVFAGLLSGIACGLKLTLLPYGAALGIAMACTCGTFWSGRITSIVAFASGICLGMLLIAGPWWLTLYLSFGNPLFPYFNNIFHSPFYDLSSMTDPRFKPTDLLHALFFPFYWLRKQHLTSELISRDPRFALAYIAIPISVIGALLAGSSKFRSGPWLDVRSWCVLIFIVVGFVAWEVQFSILRYLAPLELTVGISLLLAMRPLLAANIGSYIPHGALAAITTISLAVTVYPDWGRAPEGPVAASVVLPELAADSLVILLDSSPMAFIAAYAPPTIRFVGANNNLIQPGRHGRMQRDIEAVIRSHRGPIWGLEENTAMADATLTYYGLHRAASCVAVQSNLNNNGTKICPLSRNDG